MSGNQNSGRKTMREEKAKVEAINKAWVKVEKEIETKDVEKIALPLALKDMTVKQDFTSDGKSLAITEETRTLIDKALNRFIDGEPKENTDTRE